jgi:DNA-binding CsgD family transcriptional regulator
VDGYRFHPLTDREGELVALMADGHNPESIATQLGLTINSVRKYSGRIHAKLYVNTSLEVVAWYYKKFWVPKGE